MKKGERKMHIIDVDGKILGRIAGEIGRLLTGKGKVDYAPHLDCGDSVVVINADHVRVTGKKAKDKLYHTFSGYPGGITTRTFSERMKADSTMVLYDAVRGMLPKNKLRDRMLKRLRIYKGAEHPHEGQITK